MGQILLQELEEVGGEAEDKFLLNNHYLIHLVPLTLLEVVEVAVEAITLGVVAEVGVKVGLRMKKKAKVVGLQEEMMTCYSLREMMGKARC